MPFVDYEVVSEPGLYFLGRPESEIGRATGSPAFADFDVEGVRGDFPALHQKVHGRPLIWFDNAATTQKPRSVIEATSSFYSRDYSNIHRAAHTLAARSTELSRSWARESAAILWRCRREGDPFFCAVPPRR
jgi:hypothetical protein